MTKFVDAVETALANLSSSLSPQQNAARRKAAAAKLRKAFRGDKDVKLDKSGHVYTVDVDMGWFRSDRTMSVKKDLTQWSLDGRAWAELGEDIVPASSVVRAGEKLHKREIKALKPLRDAAALDKSPTGKFKPVTLVQVVCTFIYGLLNGLFMGLLDPFKDALEHPQCKSQYDAMAKSLKNMLRAGGALVLAPIAKSAMRRLGATSVKDAWSKFITSGGNFFKALWKLVTQCKPLYSVIGLMVRVIAVAVVITMVLVGTVFGILVRVAEIALAIFGSWSFLKAVMKKVIGGVRSCLRGDCQAKFQLSIFEGVMELIGFVLGAIFLGSIPKLVSFGGGKGLLAGLKSSAKAKKFLKGIKLEPKLGAELKTFTGRMTELKTMAKSGQLKKNPLEVVRLNPMKSVEAIDDVSKAVLKKQTEMRSAISGGRNRVLEGRKAYDVQLAAAQRELRVLRAAQKAKGGAQSADDLAAIESLTSKIADIKHIRRQHSLWLAGDDAVRANGVESYLSGISRSKHVGAVDEAYAFMGRIVDPARNVHGTVAHLRAIQRQAALGARNLVTKYKGSPLLAQRAKIVKEAQVLREAGDMRGSFMKMKELDAPQFVALSDDINNVQSLTSHRNRVMRETMEQMDEFSKLADDSVAGASKNCDALCQKWMKAVGDLMRHNAADELQSTMTTIAKEQDEVSALLRTMDTSAGDMRSLTRWDETVGVMDNVSNRGVQSALKNSDEIQQALKVTMGSFRRERAGLLRRLRVAYRAQFGASFDQVFDKGYSKVPGERKSEYKYEFQLDVGELRGGAEPDTKVRVAVWQGAASALTTPGGVSLLGSQYKVHNATHSTRFTLFTNSLKPVHIAALRLPKEPFALAETNVREQDVIGVGSMAIADLVGGDKTEVESITLYPFDDPPKLDKDAAVAVSSATLDMKVRLRFERDSHTVTDLSSEIVSDLAVTESKSPTSYKKGSDLLARMNAYKYCSLQDDLNKFKCGIIPVAFHTDASIFGLDSRLPKWARDKYHLDRSLPYYVRLRDRGRHNPLSIMWSVDKRRWTTVRGQLQAPRDSFDVNGKKTASRVPTPDALDFLIGLDSVLTREDVMAYVTAPKLKERNGGLLDDIGSFFKRVIDPNAAGKTESTYVPSPVDPSLHKLYNAPIKKTRVPYRSGMAPEHE